MAEDWASKIRESINRSNQAMDLHRRQAQAAMANRQSGGTTRYTALDTGGIVDLPPFTPNSTGLSADQFSGAPLESASFFGSGNIVEMAGPEDEESGDEGAGGPRQPPTGRPRRPSQPMQRRLMGSAGGGGLNQHFQNQRTASSWEQLQRKPSAWENMQRRNSYMPQSQQTPRQRFTA